MLLLIQLKKLLTKNTTLRELKLNQNTLSELPPALEASKQADQDFLFTNFDTTIQLIYSFNHKKY